MKVVNFGEKYDVPSALALGFFDCVHKGHAEVIAKAKELAAKSGSECAVMTFRGDPGTFFNKKKRIYSFEERLEALGGLGVDAVIAADFDESFAALSAEDFLDRLLSDRKVTAVAVGEDYTYGKGAQGSARTLSESLADRNITANVVPLLCRNGVKISSTEIKTLLESGGIEAVNDMLTEPYFMLGTVSHACGRGNTFGYPTANIPYDGGKVYPAPGVYATTVTVEGRTFLGGTNIGAKPTFGDNSPSVETFILDFSGDIYGKLIKLRFFKRLRGIEKFPSAEALAAQLDRDVAHIKEYFAEEAK